MQDISEKSTIQFRCGTPFVFCQNKTDPAFFVYIFPIKGFVLNLFSNILIKIHDKSIQFLRAATEINFQRQQNYLSNINAQLGN